MSLLHVSTTLMTIQTIPIIHFPRPLTDAFPSRGMCMATGTINGNPVTTWLEPDGMGGHFFIPESTSLQEWTEGSANDDDLSLDIHLDVVEDWASPDLPIDFQHVLEQESLLDFWKELTPKAQWEWIRWIRFTKNPATREKRLHVSCSKMHSGMRRPCCFDQTRCTLTDVSKTGVLKIE